MGVSTLRNFLSQNGFFWLYLVFLTGFFFLPSASTLAWYYSLLVWVPLLLFWQELEGLLRTDRLFWLAASYIGYLLLTALWSQPIPPEALLLGAWHGLQILGFFAATVLIWSRWGHRVEFLLSRLVWVAVVAALVSMLAWYQNHPFPKERLQTLGIMHHEVKAACAYGVIFLFSLHLALSSRSLRRRALYLGCCLILAAVVLLGQSRTALGALILGSLVLWGWRSLLLVIPLVLAAFALFLLYPDLLAEQGRAGSSFRLGIWAATYDSLMPAENEDGAVEEMARALRARLDLRHVLITRSERGMSLLDGEVCHHIPTAARDVFDVTGAGDTVIAVFTACLARGDDALTAARLANRAAGVVVGKVGTATASWEEIEARA